MKTVIITCLTFISSLSYSQELMTIGEIFDFDIGDKFHYLVTPSDVPPARDRITITDKYFSEFGDTVFYERFIDSYWTEFFWDPVPHLEYHFSNLTDTINYSNLDSLISFYDINFQCNANLYECDTNIYYSAYLCDTLVNGYHTASNEFEPDIYQKEYGKGLGWISNYYFSLSSVPPGVIWDLNMFYYQKNGIDCGTPDTITVSTPEIPLAIDPVSIFPNPVKNYFSVKINVPNTSLIFRIFNIYGVMIDSGTWTQETTKYDCSTFSPGVYTIHLIINNKSANYNLIVQ